MIDYTDTQLPDDEMAEFLKKRAAHDEQDAQKEKARWAKARGFRYSGGML